jgi:general stress protein 26
MQANPNAEIDRRFSDPEANPTPWSDTQRLLEDAELYWLTTVRSDGRPHVTPLIGVVDEGVVHFCTGLGEQKARNLEQNVRVAVTTGNNSWARGLDVVVEGTAVRVMERQSLRRLAEAYEAKYGSEWHFEVGEDAFETNGHAAAVFRVEPDKVLAFAKEPHAQTTFRLTR